MLLTLLRLASTIRQALIRGTYGRIYSPPIWPSFVLSMVEGRCSRWGLPPEAAADSPKSYRRPILPWISYLRCCSRYTNQPQSRSKFQTILSLQSWTGIQSLEHACSTHNALFIVVK